MGIKAMRKPNSGFTLIELSIVLVILGILIAGIIQFFGGIAEIRKEQETRAKIEEIQEALLAFTTKNGRLPCPANRNAAFPGSDFGIETDCQASQSFECPIISGTSERECADSGSGSNEIRTGVLPVRTLGLPDEYMFDAWDNRFTYSAIKDITEKQGSCGTYNSDSAALGVIRIQGISGDVINPPKECLDASGANPACASVAYNIISHGENGIGAFNRDGNQSIQCDTATAEGENCDNDNIFKDILENEGTGTDANALYDDIIAWETYSRIEREVFAGGSGEALGSGASFVFTIRDGSNGNGRSTNLENNSTADYIWQCLNCTSWAIGPSSSPTNTSSIYTSSGLVQSIWINDVVTSGGVDANIQVCSADNFEEIRQLKFHAGRSGGASSLSLEKIFETGTFSSDFNMPNLEDIEIDGTFVDTFPEKVLDFTNLTRLRFFNSDITSIPEGVNSLINLTQIDIGENDISTIPENLYDLVNLTRLDFTGNNLSTISTSIGNLTSLQNFSVGKNNLTTLPAAELDSIDIVNLQIRENPNLTQAPTYQLNNNGIRDTRMNDIAISESDFATFVDLIEAGIGTPGHFCTTGNAANFFMSNATDTNCMTAATLSKLQTIAATSLCRIRNSPVANDSGTLRHIVNDTTALYSGPVTCP